MGSHPPRHCFVFHSFYSLCMLFSSESNNNWVSIRSDSLLVQLWAPQPVIELYWMYKLWVRFLLSTVVVLVASAWSPEHWLPIGGKVIYLSFVLVLVTKSWEMWEGPKAVWWNFKVAHFVRQRNIGSFLFEFVLYSFQFDWFDWKMNNETLCDLNNHIISHI